MNGRYFYIFHFLFLFFLLFTRNVYADQMVNVDDVYKCPEGSESMCASWHTLDNVVVSHDHLPTVGYLTLGVYEVKNGHWDDDAKQQVWVTTQDTWASAVNKWITKYGKTGHGDLGMFYDLLPKECVGLFLSGGTGMGVPGATCTPVPPQNNRCDIKTDNINIPFGEVASSEIEGKEKTVNFAVQCKSAAQIRISPISADGTIEMHSTGSDTIDARLSVDGKNLSKDGVKLSAGAGESPHQLTATLKKTQQDTAKGDYSGSTVLMISID